MRDRFAAVALAITGAALLTAAVFSLVEGLAQAFP